MIVVDASAVLEVLTRGPAARAAEARLFAPDETLHAPELIDLEVAQVLRRFVLARRMTVALADQAMDRWRGTRVQRWAHHDLLPRVWSLRATLNAYDAAYVALAEGLGVALVTTDGKIARASGHGARVEVVGSGGIAGP